MTPLPPRLRPLEPYRRPGKARFGLYAALFGLLLSARLGGKRRGDLGTLSTLRRSPFARVIFMDVGALSTLGALYLVLNGRTRVRVPAALASLFLGSFALLPALAWEDWTRLREEEAGGSSSGFRPLRYHSGKAPER